MPIWLVRATWAEDEVEASEQWQVNAATADEAIKDVTPHIRSNPITSRQGRCRPIARRCLK